MLSDPAPGYQAALERIVAQLEAAWNAMDGRSQPCLKTCLILWRPGGRAFVGEFRRPHLDVSAAP